MYPIHKRVQSIYLFAIMLVLQACTASSPIAKADTTEQRAFATYGTFVIFEEQAAKLVSSGELSNSAVRAIGRADARAKPVADSLLAAVLEFVEIREEYEAGGTGEAKFIAAMNELNAWITRAKPLVNNLVSAVEGAK